MLLDRRFDPRVPLEIYLNAYVADRPQRAFSLNLSESGVYLNTLPHDPLPPHTPVGLEFTLPGTHETIWAAGEMAYDTPDDYFSGNGVRFVAMARLHHQLLRRFLIDARRRRLFAG